MKGAETIETRRLVLRRPRSADAEAVFGRYAGDAEVTRFVGWPRHLSLDDTRAFLEFSDAEWARWPAGPYLALARTDGALLGSCGLAFETRHRAATGYVFAREAWGLGYASESLAAMVDLAERLGVERLQALVHVDNDASWRVLEKAGFTREGMLRRYLEFPNLPPGVAADVFCYARIFASRPC